jgi:hypothetical protein
MARFGICGQRQRHPSAFFSAMLAHCHLHRSNGSRVGLPSIKPFNEGDENGISETGQ